MRLKSYNAPTMAEAMKLVREELGDDAIIVSTQRSSDGQGVRITAALDDAGEDDAIDRAISGRNTTPFSEKVREALDYHGTPPRLADKLVTAAQAVEVGSPTMACATALEDHFDFAPLPERKSPRPFMLVGPPGTGKTITTAKLAARARLAGRAVGVISADTIRAGAVEQLAAFTSILEVDLRQVRGPDALGLAVQEMMAVCDLVFIDSPGLNPFSHHDMDYLKGLVNSADVEPILVLAAGGDASEAADIGEAFGTAGATRLLATRLRHDAPPGRHSVGRRRRPAHVQRSQLESPRRHRPVRREPGVHGAPDPAAGRRLAAAFRRDAGADPAVHRNPF